MLKKTGETKDRGKNEEKYGSKGERRSRNRCQDWNGKNGDVKKVNNRYITKPSEQTIDKRVTREKQEEEKLDRGCRTKQSGQ